MAQGFKPAKPKKTASPKKSSSQTKTGPKRGRKILLFLTNLLLVRDWM